MAELLILAFDTSNPDPEKDLHAWKMGHVIDVKPDGHRWGSSEGLPKFWLVKIPGVSVSDVIDFISARLDFTDPDRPVATAIRKWKLGINDIPAAVRSKLQNEGVITVTKTAVQNYMKQVT